MSAFFDKAFQTIKSAAKIALYSRRPSISRAEKPERIVIMGNGPSLNRTIADSPELLRRYPTMAVNFAANAPVFRELKPRYYVLADPHFFKAKEDVNVAKLWESLSDIDWTMTLYVPTRELSSTRRLLDGSNIRVEGFNAVGAEGFRWFSHMAYRLGLAMPRPRNVLIPAIMLAIGAGFKSIVITGADHSWMKTLSVTDNNEVVSIQPHFYTEDNKEKERILHEYKGYPLHSIVESFAVAFRSYHHIQEYAVRRGISITNATPESFIDAFPRVKAEDLDGA